MMSEREKRHRRRRGTGSVFLVGKIFWIAYRNHAGVRVKESSNSDRETKAEKLLLQRLGAVEHRIPIVKNAERLTFNDGAKAVVDYAARNGRPSKKLEQRIAKHLTPFFGGMRLAAITTAHVLKFVDHRREQGICNKRGARVRDVSNAEINRELATLKRIFNLAIAEDKLAMRPKIAMLKESAARSGFFERKQFESVRDHLPEFARSIVTFAYLTGWRVTSEVLPLEWRRVDMKAGEIRLDPGTTKNDRGRVYPMTHELRTLLKAQLVEHERLKRAGFICPYVFFREVAEKRGGEKKPQQVVSFQKAWKKACIAAGCPGKLLHDFRRTAVRNLTRSGVPQTVAMRMTGHLTDSVFRRYDIVSEDDLRVARDLLNAAGRR